MPHKTRLTPPEKPYRSALLSSSYTHMHINITKKSPKQTRKKPNQQNKTSYLITNQISPKGLVIEPYAKELEMEFLFRYTNTQKFKLNHLSVIPEWMAHRPKWGPADLPISVTALNKEQVRSVRKSLNPQQVSWMRWFLSWKKTKIHLHGKHISGKVSRDDKGRRKDTLFL